ncbi:MAG TPA: choice-of-anchor tandem repeat GloVer-containing protein [Candidatus Binataceae bacterium]|nr:choice-of-anchor tandem repeat GloVer-containing protein [Candidatus Binataceae bacterium]
MNESGVLYGATAQGGGTGCVSRFTTGSGCGTVFSLTPPAMSGGVWNETVIHAFPFSHGGDGPQGVVFGPNGSLLGTTSGGTLEQMGQGTIFKLTPPSTSGGIWNSSVQHSFPSFAGDGTFPEAGPLASKSGFYGTTKRGGAYGAGTVFQLAPPSTLGGTWIESVLYSFTDGSDGGFPLSGLIAGNDGTIYGTAIDGGQVLAGQETCGTAFALTPPTVVGGIWIETTIFAFNFTDGCSPTSPLVLVRHGLRPP